jgi:hypothetical protein
MSGSQVIDRAPPTDVEAGGGGGGWAWLVTARGIIEAELVRGVLENAGIVPVAFDGRDPSPGAWMFLSGNVNALVRVFVPVSLLDEARLVLLETGLNEPAAPPNLPARRSWSVSTRVLVLAVTIVVVAIFLLATLRGRVS